MSAEQQRFLVPGKGLRVKDPATGTPLPEAGALVTGNETYWLRRLADGDVTEKPAAKARAERSNA